ncbi:MAG: type pantothenate kinase [Thermotogaceae bacterium]|nr:type pantothenate kinase [Thermotogaceae bacterium]
MGKKLPYSVGKNKTKEGYQLYLLIDVGNTHTTIGKSDGQKIISNWRIGTKRFDTEDELYSILKSLEILDDINKVAVASVVPSVDKSIQYFCKKYFGFMPVFVNALECKTINWNVKYPKEIGADRVANVLAAYKLFKTNAIIVDFGTAITIDVLVDNNYEGGAILPGFSTSVMALFANTAKLPQVDLKVLSTPIGKDTEENIQIGVVVGTIKAIDCLIEDIINFTNENFLVIATGGNSIISKEISKHIEIVDHQLTLKGILEFAKCCFKEGE